MAQSIVLRSLLRKNLKNLLPLSTTLSKTLAKPSNPPLVDNPNPIILTPSSFRSFSHHSDPNPNPNPKPQKEKNNNNKKKPTKKSSIDFTKIDPALLPTVIIVGRPNVGKSALFNR